MQLYNKSTNRVIQNDDDDGNGDKGDGADDGDGSYKRTVIPSARNLTKIKFEVDENNL